MADSYAMASGTDLDRLADFVTSRRVELSMEVEELAQRMGVSDKTVRRIETGNSVKRDTYAKLERALGWTPGSVRKVLAGGNPTLHAGGQSSSLNEPVSDADLEVGMWPLADRLEYAHLAKEAEQLGLSFPPAAFRMIKAQTEGDAKRGKSTSSRDDDRK